MASATEIIFAPFVAKNRKAGFGPASQGWRRHSASIGYRPHPGNHIHRWTMILFKKRVRSIAHPHNLYFRATNENAGDFMQNLRHLHVERGHLEVELHRKLNDP